MRKRGLAPLYTTLIFFAVALSIGFVVMYVSENTQTELICDYNIKLKFLEIADQEEICISETELRFTVENGVEVAVEKLELKFDTGEQVLVEAKLTKGGIYTGTIPIKSVTSVIITPIIIENGKELSCPDETLETDLRSC